MDALRLTGPGAGILKYDTLTALGIAGLNGSPTFQMSMMRLIALVTARYNWRAGELTVGQREMARLWSVNERTVKREMKRLTEAGVLIRTRAGVRGRVGAYRLNLRRIEELSRPHWSDVGPDFAARMAERAGTQAPKVVRLGDFTQPPTPAAPGGQGPWDRAMAHLQRDDPALFANWFARLRLVSAGETGIRLSCEGAFVQRYIETHLCEKLRRALEVEFGPVPRIDLTLRD